MKCDICGLEEHRNIKTQEYRVGIGDCFHYDICEACELVRLVDAPLDINKYYSNYHFFKRSKGRGGVFGLIDLFKTKSLLIRHYPKKKNAAILDVGCATGEYLLELKKRGYTNTTGIEPAEEAVKNKVDPSLDIRHSTLKEYNPSCRYNVITLRHVFEHFQEPKKELRRLAELLAPGGALVMSFPNYQSFARMIFKERWPGFDAPRHYFVYSPKNIALLAQQCGLKVNRIKYISGPEQFYARGKHKERLAGNDNEKEVKIKGKDVLLIALYIIFFFPSIIINWLGLGDDIEVYLSKSEPTK